MAEQASSDNKATKGSKIGGWLKTIGAMVFSLVSGAVIAYLSPLVTNVIKPAKPVANFQYEANGLDVVFQNRSTGGQEGFWDFGDGSALQPFVPDQSSVPHKYVKPGNYTVKLTLHNYVNDENERSVTVAVDQPITSPPVIDTFEVVPVRPDNYAPASFRLVTEVKNAELCAWAVSTQALEFSPETANGKQERFVNLKEPGKHVIKLAAYNGKETVEVSKEVEVKKPPVGTVMAELTVTYEALRVVTRTMQHHCSEKWPANLQANTHPFSRCVAEADDGYEFVKVAFAHEVKDPGVRKPKVEISQDKHKINLSGELIKNSGSPPLWTVELQITQQKRGVPITKTMEPITVNLTVPGSTEVPLPPLPPGWLATNHTLALTLNQDGKHMAWDNGQLPCNVAVQMSSALFIVNASEQDKQLRIDLAEVPNVFNAMGN
jgi:PKD repeat protein